MDVPGAYIKMKFNEIEPYPMSRCTSDDLCWFRHEDGERCTRDFGLKCPHEEDMN